MTPLFQYTPNAVTLHPVVKGLSESVRNFSPQAQEAARLFPMRLPLALAERISWEADDPVAREFLPSDAEMEAFPGWGTDPLQEAGMEPVPGLLRKYAGRVLLKVTMECAVHCRFCFRRHASGAGIPRTLREWEPAMTLIGADRDLHEVILSGGDPLTLSDRRLSGLARRLAGIPHLTRLRVHTRMPVVAPERVTSGLTHWLRATRLTPVVVIHANHPAELGQGALASLARLADAGIPLLSQSVLLKGVNDDPRTLAALFERLVDARVIPYYLHLPDPVAGTAHFRVEEEVANGIIRELWATLPGYAVPRLAREVPGDPGKRLV
ncbi:MAG: KamA family radical SAM protein [Magnetococcales bacterium]|nr:KamA family radical SAM protein [Magnetococcales bacterium]